MHIACCLICLQLQQSRVTAVSQDCLKKWRFRNPGLRQILLKIDPQRVYPPLGTLPNLHLILCLFMFIHLNELSLHLNCASLKLLDVLAAN